MQMWPVRWITKCHNVKNQTKDGDVGWITAIPPDLIKHPTTTDGALHVWGPWYRDCSWPCLLIRHLFLSDSSPPPPPRLCMAFDRQLVYPHSMRLGHGRMCRAAYIMGCIVRDLYNVTYDKCASILDRLIVLIRHVCSRFIPKGFKHQSALPWAMASIEMCTLASDSLLTGLPGLVKATGSFSETKASFHTHNKRLSSPAAIYLPFNSCRLSFLAVVFSCLPAWPSVGVEGNTRISGSMQLFSFVFFSFCHDSLIAKISLKPLLISREASKNHILHAGQSSTGIHCDSSVSFCLLQGCVRLSWRCRIG